MSALPKAIAIEEHFMSPNCARYDAFIQINDIGRK
jgi:hypothetical protein